ncbi:MAG: SpoIIE family protein phosphatase [Ruminococcus sp.]|nr:SpoIIE family protein phosphatase [Ruminococcus sp.]
MSIGIGTGLERLGTAAGLEADGTRRIRRGREVLLKCVLAAAAGFLSGFGKMIGFGSYMCVAAAAVSGRYSGAVLIGTAVSCLFGDGFAAMAAQLGSMLTMTALNVFFPDYSRGGEPIRLTISTAAVTLLFSCIISAGGADSFTLSMRIIGSLMSACIVFAAATVSGKRKSGEPVRVGGLTAVCLAMIYIAAVTTLCSCALGKFNLGRIAACAVIPAAAKKRRAAGGAVLGALTAVAVTMCSATLAVNTMLLAAAGLICSAFADLGRLPCAAAFLVSAAAALAASGLNGDTFPMLADLIVGTVIFAAVPSGTLAKLSTMFMVTGSPADCAGQTASARLNFAAMTISDIRRRLVRAAEAAERRTTSVTFGDRVMNKLCTGCRLYDECRANGCAANVERACEIDPESPSAVGCIRGDELAAVCAECRSRELYERAEAVRMKEMGTLFREQLGVMSDLLNDLSCRISRRRETDVKLSAAARSFFERRGFAGVRACVYTDETLARHVEIYLGSEPDDRTLSLTAGLCRALEIDLEMPGITTAGGVTKLEFDELPPFSAETGSWSAAGGECSGDSLEFTETSAGEKFVLLSDGMGSGRRARLDSGVTVSLAGRLLRSGLSMRTAQRVINSVMQSKDWEESFATLDFLRLDLFSGRAEFLKSGAAPAYLCRDGSMVRIASDSFPAGIFVSADPDLASVKVFDGDILMLATDGAPEEALEEAARLSVESPEMKAGDIARLTGLRCRELAGVRHDDMTVAIIKISLRKPSHDR